MKIFLGFGLLLFISVPTLAQQQEDSVEILSNVIIRAFGYNRKYSEIPASISIVSKAALERFNNTSVLPAMNSQPGIRMEERSPGSYRLNIRGSALRSPFGVRNVKIYYNDIPYTDPGGNSFFNQLGYYNIQSMEIIKGPGSSVYGAGTGGVVLINSERNLWRPGADLDYSAGSYALKNFNINLRAGTTEFRNTINYQQQESDGYRDHTQMTRKSFTWDASAKVSDKGSLSTHFLYGDLSYQTPGALTLQEFEDNPKASRPAAGISPSAKEARAAINTKMFMAGIRYQHQFSKRWTNTTTIYGAFAELKNPTIRNFERRTEPHTGGRTVFEYASNTTKISWKANVGLEYQQGFATIRVADNVQGTAGALQSDDEFSNRQLFGFAQISAEINGGWVFTIGASTNQLSVSNNRLFPTPSLDLYRKYSNELAPRFAVLKKINSLVSVFASVARGFSPPTNAELLPSTGEINYDLEAESGYNFEAGIRGSLINDRLYIDVNAFFFNLKNTIAQRRDPFGADFFVNAGSTHQQGVESFVSYKIPFTYGLIERINLEAAHTWHKFNYSSYLRGDDDFSGKRLPGIAPHVINTTLDIKSRPGIYLNLTWFYSAAIALNDANSFHAAAFDLTGARMGFRKRWTSFFATDLFFSIDNIFNKTYSLGNDINAFGNRFYNAAAGINYTAGISLKTNF